MFWATPMTLLAILLVIIAVLFVVLLIRLVQNYRRYGSMMPPARANALLPPLPADTTKSAPAAALPLPKQPATAVIPAAAYLEQVANGSPPRIFPLDKPVTVIGRDAACDICIDEHLVNISRRHAQIVREEDTYLLSDLSSSSGVYVNGVRIGRNRVRDGAVIRIGQEVQYTFHLNPARGAS